MNYLATINTGNFMCDNVRASFQHAANRWGAEYVEITGPVAGERDYWLDIKMSLWKDKRFAGNRVFYLDGDILVRDDCPNPFDEVPAGMFGAVLNCQSDPDGYVTKAQRFGWDVFASFAQPSRPYTGAFINGGVLLFEPDTHGHLFEKALQLFHCVGREYGGGDQAALSVVIDSTFTPMHVLDWRWNCVGPVAWEWTNQRCPHMPAWITHYAKFMQYRGENRREILDEVIWDTKAKVHRVYAEIDRRNKEAMEKRALLPDPPALTDRTDLSQIPAMIT